MSQQENLEKLIREILLEEKLEDGEVSFKFATEPGDGYMGVMKGAEIRGRDKELSLILKTAPTSQKLRESNPIREPFLQEIFFYKSLWPKLEEFQEKHKVANKFTGVAKCYKTDDTPCHEVIVMENLLKKNFSMFDRRQKFSEKHMEFVFAEYAKFHGLSYAFKTLHPELFRSLSAQLLDIFEIFTEKTKILQVLKNIALRLVDEFDPNAEGFYREKFRKFAENLEEQTKHCLTATECATFTHGDCWCNNMMFKFDESKGGDCPAEIRLLDFQIVRSCSPVLDLCYCFYTSGCSASIDNYKHYLNFYHDALSSYLAQYSIKADDHLTLETLHRHWQKFSKYGLILGLVVLKVQVTDTDEVPDLAKEAEEDRDMMEGMDFVSKNEDEFNRRIKILIKHFCDNNLI